MFILFFYLLRTRGYRPSINQWMTLMEALEKDMADSSLTKFYNLCRCILVNSEADFDQFDQIFSEFFGFIANRDQSSDEILAPQAGGGGGGGNQVLNDFQDWLHLGHIPPELYYSPEHMEIIQRLEEIFDRLIKKLEEQIRSGMGDGVGSGCLVCVGCGACSRSIGFAEPESYGSGYEDTKEEEAAEKRRAQHEERKNALAMAGQRRFRDFREDTVLDIRQFQVAFRRLRSQSSRFELEETELDIDKTVNKTADNAGLLRIVMSPPRRNTIKLLVLFDSDGSMWTYADLSNRLFQALNKANHFKDKSLK